MKTGMKRSVARILTLVMALCLLVSLAVPAAAVEAAKGLDEVKYGVLKFKMTLVGSASESVASGSAFLINEDTIVTAGHCARLSKIYMNALGIEGDIKKEINDRLEYAVIVERDVTIGATLITSSEEMDFAILKLDQPIQTRKYLPLRDSSTVKAAEPVYSVGFPDYYDKQNYDNNYRPEDVTIKNGIVTKPQALTEYYAGEDYFHFKGEAISTNCELSGGDSGGPMVDQDGNVIGVAISGVQAGLSEQFYHASAVSQIIRTCDSLGIEYHLAGETAAAEEPTEAATEAPATVATEAPATEAPATEAPAPTEAPTPTEAPAPAPQPEPSPLMPILIVAAVVVAIAVVVVIIVMTKSKKKPAPEPVAVGGGNTGGFQTGPVKPAYTAPIAPAGAGETTVLSSDAGETTVLSRNVNGGTLIRKRGNETITINAERFVIGRERKTSNYCISDNSSISRSHVTLTVRNGVTYLTDMGGANGTFVNGVKAMPKQEIALKNGDKVTLADEEFEYRI